MATSRLAPVWASATTLPIADGSGCWVTTTDGERYLDFTAGIAVAATGHCHPQVVAAIQKQAGRLIHGQVNCYRHDLLEPLAERLDELTPSSIDTFFFSNSGAEITEAAVKLAKAASGRGNVVVFAGSFHGRTHLAMAMTTSKTAYRIGYSNLPPGVFVAPFPDLLAPDQDAEVARCLAALEELMATQTAPADTAAVVLEPVIGEGGYLPAPPEFFRGVAEICRRHNVLFVADEVQTGFGRTGTMFAIERFDVVPDILMMAKGIASGLPLSALGASAELMSRWPVGSHGGTYGGNPVACAAALATIDIVTGDGFLANVDARGDQLRAGLADAVAEVGGGAAAGVVDVRGLGLMNAVEFANPARCKAVIAHLLDESRVITMGAGPTGAVLRWMPPLVVDEAEVGLAVEGFRSALAATIPSDAVTTRVRAPQPSSLVGR